MDGSSRSRREVVTIAKASKPVTDVGRPGSWLGLKERSVSKKSMAERRHFQRVSKRCSGSGGRVACCSSEGVDGMGMAGSARSMSVTWWYALNRSF